MLRITRNKLVALFCLIIILFNLVACANLSEEDNTIGNVADLDYAIPRSYQYQHTVSSVNNTSECIDNEVIQYKELRDLVYYDKLSDSFVTYSQWTDKLEVYNADTTEKRYSILAYSSRGFAFGGGRIAEIINTNQSSALEKYFIRIIDLQTGDTLEAIEITGYYMYLFSPYGIVGDIVIYTTPFNSSATFLNVVTGESYQSEKYLGSHYIINYEENILYTSDDSHYEKTLNFIDISTGEIFKSITVANDDYYLSDFALSGNVLRFCGKVFDPVNGELLSDTSLIKNYNALIGFTPVKILWSDDNYDIVSGYFANGNGIAVYDNNINKYVFSAPGSFLTAEYGGNGKYHLFNGDKYATVDTKNISGFLEENLDDNLRITKEWGGRVHKIYFSKKYTNIAIDGGLLYLAFSNTVSVYKLNTYEFVKEIVFTENVYCLDAFNNILSIGFGKDNKFLR